MKWQLIGNTYYQAVEERLLQFPSKGIYQVVEEKRPGGIVVGLNFISDSFKFNHKLYDLGVSNIQNRILKTWDSEYYYKLNKNLGVVYNGLKGTGKTIAAKVLCNELNLPVLLISRYFEGLLEFIQSIDFDCAIFIDEAEKVFGEDSEASTSLLRMIDGVVSNSRKLFILTTNNLVIDDNLLDRPSRIRYIKEFSNLPLKAIEEMIEDKLVDKSLKSEVMQEIEKLQFSTVDIVENIISEFNIHGNLAEENMFNIPSKDYYIPLLSISVDSYYVNQGLISLDDIVELSKKLNISKNRAIFRNSCDPDDIQLEDLSLKPIREDDKNIQSYIISYFSKKLDANYVNGMWIGRYTFKSWTPNLYLGLTENSSEMVIKEMKSDCLKLVRTDNDDRLLFGILI